MRREVEAAEAIEESAPAAKKTATKKAAKKKAAKKKAATRTRKKKADIPVRRRLIWVLYSSTMREEGRYLYHERDKAEEKLQALLAKGKRRYFLQPIKEPLDSEGNPMVPDAEESVKVKKVTKTEDADADSDPDAEAGTDGDAEADGDADTETAAADGDAPEEE